MSYERAAVLHDNAFWASMIRFLGDGGGGDAWRLATPHLRRTCVCADVAQQYHRFRLRGMALQRNLASSQVLVADGSCCVL